MKQEPQTPSEQGRAHLARALLDELAGRPTSSTPELMSLAEARELRDDDLAGAREIALIHSHFVTLRDRVRAAVAIDQAPVLLDDGSRLTLDEAERALAAKEERKAFPPLRRALARAAEPLEDQRERSHERFREVFAEVIERPSEQLSDAKAAAALLDRFLTDVKDGAEEARSALAREGRVLLEDPSALARGLDLPDAEGFSEDAIRRLGRALGNAAEKHQRRALKAVRAPRALAGVMVTADPGPVRMATCPSARAARFLALTSALGGSAALSLLEATPLPPSLEDEALLLGGALAIGSSTAVVRRAVLGEPAAQAERRARVLAATRLLLAQTQAHAARVLLEGEGRDALRETLLGVLGVDPPAALLDSLSTPPWPGLMHLRGPAASAGAEVARLGMSAALATALRGRYDEAFPLVPFPYELFGGARDALAEGAVSALELAGAHFDKEHPGRALVEWTAELL